MNMNTPTGNSDVLEIGWDDLNSPETTRTVDQLRQAQVVPLVRQVGVPEQDNRRWYNGHLVQSALAGLFGGVLTWGMAELLIPETWSATATNVAFTVSFALGIGLVLVLWEAIAARSGAKLRHDLVKKAPIVAGMSVAAGVVIDQVYQAWIEALSERLLRQGLASGWSELDFLNAMMDAIHLPRGVAWALVGITVGASVGIAARKRQRIINGIIGGAAGGFVAGFAFDYFPGDVSARSFGILFTGLAIGLSIGLVEQARRQHWLEIQTGGMAGKQFILYAGETSIGSSPTCDVTLIKDPAVAAHHVTLEAGDSGLSASTAPGASILINGVPTTQRALADGDTITIGSTVLRYRDKSDVAIPAGQIVG